MGVVGQLLGGDELARNYFKQYRKFVQEWVNKNPKWAYNYIMLGLAYSRLGQTKRGWELAQKAMEIDSTQHFGLAQILSVLGRRQEAIDHLELAIENGYTNYIWIKIHPDFQELYDEPRFKDLISLGLKSE